MKTVSPLMFSLILGLLATTAGAQDTLPDETMPGTAVASINPAVSDPAATTDMTTEPDSATVGKLKVQSIRVEDRFGAIEEERVQAMRSELRYVPSGSADGYNLIGAENSQGKSQNAHTAADNLMIPSWKLFSW